MGTAGVGGVLSIPQGPTGWAYGSILEGAGVSFQVTRFDPRDGSKIRFWDDVWFGEISLKATFPILYNIANVKDFTVANNMDLSSGTL